MATEAFEQIVDDFQFLEDWESRYRYVIDMGKSMTPLEENLRSSATKVDGCASQVWIVPEVMAEHGISKFHFRGDSDAMIVRGLIAVLRTLYNGLALNEVLEIDASRELLRLGLQDHLSSQRSNGLKSMIQRIRQIVGMSKAS